MSRRMFSGFVCQQAGHTLQMMLSCGHRGPVHLHSTSFLLGCSRLQSAVDRWPHFHRSPVSLGRRSFLAVRSGEMEDQGVVLRNSYNAQINATYWDTRPVVVTTRLIQIGMAFGAWYTRSLLWGRKEKAAADLRDVLTYLGPAFVKIGQAVSSRPDVIPPDYIRELEKLQDRIPPFPTEEAFQTILEDLGKPADELFSQISYVPVAAASLGQVYKAVVKRTGEVVAVKVQRPGVVEQIALDVYILRRIAKAFREWRKLNSDLPALIDEWATSLFRELDYQREASNGEQFSELFAGMRGVYVPRMDKEMTTARVLIMEWVDGEKLRTASSKTEDDLRGSSDDLKLVEVGVRCSLEQMLGEGFYHADPHPGNLLRMECGRLCYLDFGMMGWIDHRTRQALIRATLHLVNKEFEALAEDFVTLGFLPTGSQKDDIVPALTGVFEEALAGGVGNLSFGDLSADLGRTMYKYKFQIPPYYTLLVRSLTVLEGIALASEPNYKVLSAAYPWVARRLLTDKSEELRKTLKALLYKGGKFNFSRLEVLLKAAVRSPAKEDMFSGMANGVGNAGDEADEDEGVVPGRPLQFLLKEEGLFVREILMEEVAKGLDAAWRIGVDGLVEQTKSKILTSLQGMGWVGNDGRSDKDRQQLVHTVEALLALPALAQEEDREQVDGIWRLAQAMQAMADGQEMGGNGRLSNVTEAAMALSWVVQESQALPPAAREEALRIPLVLASKLSSRIIARGLRSTLPTGPTVLADENPDRQTDKPGEDAARQAQVAQ